MVISLRAWLYVIATMLGLRKPGYNLTCSVCGTTSRLTPEDVEGSYPGMKLLCPVCKFDFFFKSGNRSK